MRRAGSIKAAIAALIVGALALPASGAEPVAVQRITALKARLAEDQSVLRQYEWIETATISIKGEVKSRKLQRCSYDADGTVRKVPFNPAGPENKRFKLQDNSEINVEARNGEPTKYMQEAVNLVQQYVPLNPNGIKATADESKLWFSVSDPGKRGQLNIRDFLVRGDYVILDMDLISNRPLSLKISSFLATEGVPASLSVTFGSLYGSAAFVREALFDAKEMGLKITVQNSDFNKIVP